MDDVIVIENDGSTSCAICLIDYKEGDVASSSNNRACQHVFHRDCIFSWLKSHDECPCCRQDYLAFSDQYDEDDNLNTGDSSNCPVNRSSNDDEVRNTQLDRLYGMDEFESNTASIGFGNEQPDEAGEPWEALLERNLERLRRQVEDRVQAARNHLRERRESNRRGIGENGDDDEEDEGRLEQSIQLLRLQLARVRQAATREIQNRQNNSDVNRTSSSRHAAINRRGAEDRLDDAFQVVRARLDDIANSEVATRLRERSTRTMQHFMKQASNLRR